MKYTHTKAFFTSLCDSVHSGPKSKPNPFAGDAHPFLV